MFYALHADPENGLNKAIINVGYPVGVVFQSDFG